MVTGTGKTIYELILSLDTNNSPVSGATFDSLMFRNGVEYTGVTVDISLTEPLKGVFSASWSASTEGNYQFYAKNNSTSTVFISSLVLIKPDNELSPNIYIGL